MTARRRAVLTLVLGTVAVAWPLAVWGVVIALLVRDPDTFHDQGGMLLTLILFPLALLGALACGFPALVLRADRSAANGGAGPRWRWVGPALAVLGLLLAVGTCIGPRVLFEAIP